MRIALSALRVNRLRSALTMLGIIGVAAVIAMVAIGSGARARDVLLQFLVEAVTLSVLGGTVGIAVGIGASSLILYFAPWSTLVNPGAILLAFVFSAAVGVFFGYYPARKAAVLDRIVALRYE